LRYHPDEWVLVHHYHFLLKLTILLGVIVCLNQIFRVSFALNFLRWIRRMPAWLSAAVQFFEADGWILIPAVILASVWEIAERL